MKKLLLPILVLILALPGRAQIVSSSCDAPDSVQQLYRDDIDRMAVRHAMKYNTTWQDSARIEPARVQHYKDVLMAIYNASSLPASDTVTELLNIHTQVTEFALDEINIYADSNLSWMQAYMANALVTGDAQVDSLMQDYSLDSIAVYRFSSHNVALWLFFEQNRNLFALGNKFEQLNGVVQATPHIYRGGNGGNITDTTYSGFTEITYQYGWVDCIIECWYHRYWVFRVYPDCSVEYIGSYGDVLPPDIGLRENDVLGISIYPNPFTDQLVIEHAEDDHLEYQLYAVSGQPVARGSLGEDPTIHLPTELPPGLYILQLKDTESGQIHNFQLIK